MGVRADVSVNSGCRAVCHRLDGLNSRNLFSPSSGSWEVQDQGTSQSASCESSFLVCRWPPSPRELTRWTVLSSLPLVIAPHLSHQAHGLMTLFNMNDLLQVATHSSTLAWKIPRTEEPGRLQSMGSQSRI